MSFPRPFENVRFPVNAVKARDEGRCRETRIARSGDPRDVTRAREHAALSLRNQHLARHSCKIASIARDRGKLVPRNTISRPRAWIGQCDCPLIESRYETKQEALN